MQGTITDARPANFIEFPYDWRLDNRFNAKLLTKFAEDRLSIWRRYSDNPKARVIYVAHSIGGWQDCRALITFGTPYRGSLNALDFLSNGYKRWFVDLTDAMRSFPSVHQLLPIYKVLRIRQEYVRVAETRAVPGVDSGYSMDALNFHREIETAVSENQKDAKYRNQGYVIVPIVGTQQPTMQSATLADGHLKVEAEPPAVDR
jgi:hypothetical protein